jgi:hypothetical protein
MASPSSLKIVELVRGGTSGDRSLILRFEDMYNLTHGQSNYQDHITNPHGVDHYEAVWKHRTSANGRIAWSASTSTVTTTNVNWHPIYIPWTAPDDADMVRVKVKAVAKKQGDKEPWTEQYTKLVYYLFKGNKPGLQNKKITDAKLGLQGNTGTTIFATWSCDYQSQVDHFEVEWKYDAGNGIWFDGQTVNVDADKRQATYNAPSGFKRVRFRIKPVSKIYVEDIRGVNQSGIDAVYSTLVSGQYNTAYWNGVWSDALTYDEDNYVPPTTKSKVTYFSVDLQNGTDRTLFATWTWTATAQTDHFEVEWKYDTGNGVWFDGATNNADAAIRIDTYNAPSNAKRVRARILPVSKEITKTTSTGMYKTAYWQGEWSAYVYYDFVEAKTPAKPSVPTVTMEGFTLTAELDTYDENTQYIEFEVVKNNEKTIKSGQSRVVTNHAAFTCVVDAGGQYKVRARGLLPVSATPKVTNQVKTTVGNCEAGEWSEYSSNVTTIPTTPAEIKSHTALSVSSVQLEWDAVANATGYTVEYTTDKMFFDSSNEPKSQSVEGVTSIIITGLESGQAWYFRLQATNSQGGSGWTPIYSVILGKAPAAPTTWSETSTVVVGEAITLYWMHNSEDSSNQSDAEIELTANGASYPVEDVYLSTDGTASYATVQSLTYAEDILVDENETSILTSSNQEISLDLYSSFPAGTVLQWRVRTKGIVDEWGPWSVIRTVTVYEQPSIELIVSDQYDFTNYIHTLNSFPLYLNAVAYPAAQTAIGWNLSITANEAYETRNANGRTRYVRAGEEIYSKYISSQTNELSVTLSAGDISFESNASYTINLTVIMNSSLTATETASFNVVWAYDEYEPNAEVTIDTDQLCAYILPYCRDDNGDPISDILLSVYRREYDGRFVEIATDLDNSKSVTVTDPHPALDMARYRIVAKSIATGHISYFDMPGVPVNETGIIIQWDEEWSNYNYDNLNNDPLTEPVWTGSFLRLPYNIAVSDSYGMDVSLVEYIGRAHPVSYYGTQLGVESSWSSDIPRDDSETLYALRRLAIYQGDVYVREPSGSGYWAHVNPSFDRSYDNMTIPVSLQLTRVEGGI